ncbi:MAG: IclR family transcriptional regulator [Aeromicrobium sp.]|jgi:IclR family acetate operon transcriptional repressor|nr:IclR family transcriptional regulator [Aeromicrobium sp.]
MPNHSSSLLRGLSVLDTFRAEDTELSLTQIAARGGMPLSTAHRLAGDLVAWGGLVRTPTGLRLGMRLFELGRFVPVQRELAEVARPFLNDLFQITRKTVNLAVLDGNEIVYVEKLEAPDIPTVSRSGKRYPLHCTALGKAILAFSPPELVDQTIDAGLSRVTSKSITNGQVFRRELAAVRKTRLGFDREELTLGLFCIGTPVFDGAGALVGAISVSSLESVAGARNLGPTLLTIARALSRDLGDAPHVSPREAGQPDQSRTLPWSA